MDLAGLIFNYERLKSSNLLDQLDSIQNQIMENIEKNNMSSLYLSLAAKFEWETDNDLLKKMR